MRDIVVAFSRVRILDGASLSVSAGEVHALLGENGAGKSSLMKVLFGLYAKEEGQVFLRGEPADFNHPRKALARGVAMIHQEVPFANHLTVAQNIFLGREFRRGAFIDENRINKEAAKVLEMFPIDTEPQTRMGTLGIAQQQIVAIAKALSTGANLIVLDEATSALTGHEADRLFEIIGRLAEGGKTFIMITHRMDEVYRIAQRVTILRDGRTVYSGTVKEETPRALVRHMVGRDMSELYPERLQRTAESTGPPLLEVTNLTTRKLKGVSCSVRRGEVVGLAGLVGAGRTSFFDALFGVIPIRSGEIHLNGVPMQIKSERDAIRHSMAYVTEDRKRTGLALHLGIKENVELPQIKRHRAWGMIDDHALRRLSRRYEKQLGIEGKVSRTVGVLSGGNQQKVVLAKWLATGADLFLLDEPTRGIDVGSKHDIFRLIRLLAAEEKAILLATSELPELLAMSDRILVLAAGRLVKELRGEDATPDEVMYYASEAAAAA